MHYIIPVLLNSVENYIGRITENWRFSSHTNVLISYINFSMYNILVILRT